MHMEQEVSVLFAGGYGMGGSGLWFPHFLQEIHGDNTYERYVFRGLIFTLPSGIIEIQILQKVHHRCCSCTPVFTKVHSPSHARYFCSVD